MIISNVQKKIKIKYRIKKMNKNISIIGLGRLGKKEIYNYNIKTIFGKRTLYSSYFRKKRF